MIDKNSTKDTNDSKDVKDTKAVAAGAEQREPTTSNLAQSSNTRVKPTLDSKFHIDYTWWDKEGRDLHAYLISHLLPEQAAAFTETQSDDLVDWVVGGNATIHRRTVKRIRGEEKKL